MFPRKSLVIAGLSALLACASPALAAPDANFGLSAPDAASGDRAAAAIDARERRLRRPVRIVLSFHAWGGDAPIDMDWLRAVTRDGRIPLVTWEPWAAPADGADPAVAQDAYRLRRIAEGAHDAYIERMATALRGFGQIVYLRPMHEMNGTWYPWGGTVNGNTAEDFVAAWRRVHRIFERAGAANVRWVWSPLHEDVPAASGNRFERYYPGSRYVDVLGLSGFNWGSRYPQNGGWRSFGDIFLPAYRRIVRLGRKPVWITETASAPHGGDKARWVHDMFRTARRLRRLRTIVWFDIHKEVDWRTVSSPRVAQAFRAAPARQRGASDETSSR